jgi:hypothetical protein
MTTLLTALSLVLGFNSVGVQGSPLLDNATAVRILLGVTDKEPVRWDGEVRLAGGEIIRIDPWRMRPADQITGASGWKATSYQLTSPPQGTPRYSPTGVVLTLRAARGSGLDVSTPQGDFRVPLDNVKPGVRQSFLDGRVLVDGVVPSVQITSGDTENDFPAAATGPNGTSWVAYIAHTARGPRDLQPLASAPESFRDRLVPQGGGDQVFLLRLDAKGWSEPIPMSEPGIDAVRPSAAVDAENRVTVVWSQLVKDRWQLFYRVFPSQTAGPVPLASGGRTGEPLEGVDPVLVSDGRRRWLEWQRWTEGQADVWTTGVGDDPALAKPSSLSNTAANEWSPSGAVDSKGRVYWAFDTYRAGNYDVLLQIEGEATAIASSSRFEARPSVACDAADRVWVAYEQRAADWGKDFGPLAPVQGSPLYMRGSSVQVRCVQNGKLLQSGSELMKSFPDDLKRLNSFPRIAFDGRGRLWLLFRHRHEAVWGANPSAMIAGGVWLEYATYFDGGEWSAPIFLAASDNVLDVRPAFARTGSGDVARLVAVYPGDGRLRHEVIGEDHQRKIFFTGGGVSVSGQVKTDLYAAVLPDLGPVKAEWNLVAANADKPGAAGVEADVPAARGATPLDPDPESKVIHSSFAGDLKRIRDYRVESGGKSYRLLRGEFHRHTEWSMDGGEDGSLEDMWRYAIDAASLDWIGNGDHDSGGGREYPWWIIQKSTEVYHHAPHFVPMFTYERSVPYPNGHRNCMFDRRGIRTLPRLMGDEPGGVSVDDTKMLYRYLKEMGGICASHTSGTGMGTDWRDNDPISEPIVEIYQGDRNSYEQLGGPRVARKQGEAIGGWKPLGMVWNAMAMGYKFGFQSSSDHWSTHISYAIAIAEQPTRGAILDAFKKRRCYAATDNIILDVRMGDALMGDEVTFKRGAKPQPKLSVRIHGTAPLARVDVIKDFTFAYSAESKDAALEFDWTDPEPRVGLSWYYVRVLQTDGQLAWGSPIWVQIPVAASAKQ